MNDEERRLWVLNDESLYKDYIRSRQSMSKYLKTNRGSIDGHIKEKLK